MLKFNGIEIPSFVKVNDIKNSLLPNISQSTMKINNKAGLIDYGNEIGVRNIEVAITIIASNITDLRAKVRELAEWLYYEEAKKLVILEEENVYYNAKFTGDSVLSEILSIGKCVLIFTCNDPFAYNTVERNYQFMPTENAPYGFENNGNTETYPRIEFDFVENATEFSIVTNDEYLYFGNPIQVGVQEPIDANPLVLAEPFSTIPSANGWTSGVSLIDGGVIDKQFSSNGWSISVADWGDGQGYTGWHGASSIKSLPYELDQFKFKFRIGLHGTKIESLGRIHLYGLDINGNKIFMIELRDGSINLSSPYARWTIGNKTIMETYGGNAGNGKIGGGVVGYWTGFTDGFFDIARRKNAEGNYVWQVWIARYESKTKTTHHSLLHQWVDKNNEFPQKLASVQIHIGAYKDVPVSEYLYIQELNVYDEDPVPSDNQVPFAFKQGDQLMVDSSTGQITLNGEDFFQFLDPASKFIKFRSRESMDCGSLHLKLSPMDSISYRERWL